MVRSGCDAGAIGRCLEGEGLSAGSCRAVCGACSGNHHCGPGSRECRSLQTDACFPRTKFPPATHAVMGGRSVLVQASSQLPAAISWANFSKHADLSDPKHAQSLPAPRPRGQNLGGLGRASPWLPEVLQPNFGQVSHSIIRAVVNVEFRIVFESRSHSSSVYSVGSVFCGDAGAPHKSQQTFEFICRLLRLK